MVVKFILWAIQKLVFWLLAMVMYLNRVMEWVLPREGNMEHERRMAEALVLSVIQKVNDWLRDVPPDILPYIHDDTKWIIDELRGILGFMRDKKLKEGRRLHYLICDIKEMAMYLDEWDWGCFDMKVMSKSYQGGMTYHDMRMNFVQSWFKEINQRMRQSRVDGAKVGSETDEEGSDDDDDDIGDVVGLEADVKQFLRRAIFHERKKLSTSVITGMAGVGKTTLARKVYNHAAVVARFKRRAWLSVSSILSHREVVMKLIEQVVDCGELQKSSLLEIMEGADNRTLQSMLRQQLTGMRYLIVLDNLPIDMRLVSVLEGLPVRATNGSRLILTSRSRDVRVTPIHYTHEMKTLDSDKSWQLFLKTIHEHNFPKHLKRKGMEMLRKSCDGLPLAIKEVGKQLAIKRQSGGEWEQLLDIIDLDSTLKLLESSYNELDPDLKSCFVHLAFFKENLRVAKLTQIWTLVGMIMHSTISCAYIGKLIKESFLESNGRTTDHGLKSCHINIVLHKLSIKKAEEEIGFEILSSSGNNPPSPNPRHRVIICSRDKFDYSTNQDKHLISLFFHGGGYLEDSPSYWNSLKLLKILDLEDFGLKVLPESIDTLTELRYLGLRDNHIEELPYSLSSLSKLEVLDIAQNFMVEMPNILQEMRSLQHLFMSEVICRHPLKIDGLKYLETLTYISVDNWRYDLRNLRMMTNLDKLGIEELDQNTDVGKLLQLLSVFSNVHNVILRGFRFRSMPHIENLGFLHGLVALKLDGLLPRLPSAGCFPPNVAYLKLFNSCLDEDPMPVLEKLSMLEELKLRNAYTGPEMVILDGSFPVLRLLCIEESWNLTNVQVGEDAMPQLEHFEINTCPCLESLPVKIDLDTFKVVTTREVATVIQKSGLVSKIRDVDVIPKVRLIA